MHACVCVCVCVCVLDLEARRSFLTASVNAVVLYDDAIVYLATRIDY